MASFKDLLPDGLGAGILTGILKSLTQALKAPLAGRAGQSFLHETTEGIDLLFERTLPGLDVDQQEAFGLGVTEEVAKNFEELAALYRAYGPLQAKVERLKKTGAPAEEIQAARRLRTAAAREIKLKPAEMFAELSGK